MYVTSFKYIHIIYNLTWGWGGGDSRRKRQAGHVRTSLKISEAKPSVATCLVRVISFDNAYVMANGWLLAQLQRSHLASATRCCRTGFLQTVGQTLLLLVKVPSDTAYPGLSLVEIEMSPLLLFCLACGGC